MSHFLHFRKTVGRAKVKSGCWHGVLRPPSEELGSGEDRRKFAIGIGLTVVSPLATPFFLFIAFKSRLAYCISCSSHNHIWPLLLVRLGQTSSSFMLPLTSKPHRSTTSYDQLFDLASSLVVSQTLLPEVTAD